MLALPLRKLRRTPSNQPQLFIIPQESITTFFSILPDPADLELQVAHTGSIYDVPGIEDRKIIVAKNECTHEIEYYVLDTVKLGEGAQGEVRVAQSLCNPKLKVAVKILKPNCMSFEEDLAREQRNLKYYKRLIATAAEGNDVHRIEYILMEYYPGINLMREIYEIDENQDKESPEYYCKKKKLSQIHCLDLGVMALAELIALHEAGIALLDVKTDNYVYKKKGAKNLKIVDLGSAIIVEQEKCLDFFGTPGYIAPEMYGMVDNPYACDVYSLGIVFAELFSIFNFQQNLKKKIIGYDKADVRYPLYLDDIKLLMPDMFDDDNRETEIISTIINLIKLMTLQDPALRPDLNQLRAIYTELQHLQCKMTIQDSCVNSSQLLSQYKQHRRENYPILSRQVSYLELGATQDCDQENGRSISKSAKMLQKEKYPKNAVIQHSRHDTVDTLKENKVKDNTVEKLNNLLKILSIEEEHSTENINDVMILSLFKMKITRTNGINDPQQREDALQSLQNQTKRFRQTGRQKIDDTVQLIQGTITECISGDTNKLHL